jgi:hypothetical protein
MTKVRYKPMERSELPANHSMWDDPWVLGISPIWNVCRHAELEALPPLALITNNLILNISPSPLRLHDP